MSSAKGACPWLTVLHPELRALIATGLDTLSLGSLASTCRRMAVETYEMRLGRPPLPHYATFAEAWRAGVRNDTYLKARFLAPKRSTAALDDVVLTAVEAQALDQLQWLDRWFYLGNNFNRSWPRWSAAVHRLASSGRWSFLRELDELALPPMTLEMFPSFHGVDAGQVRQRLLRDAILDHSVADVSIWDWDD